MQANTKFSDAKTQFKRSVIYYKPPSCTFTPSLWYRASIWLAKSVYTRPFANLAAQVPKKVAFLTGRIFEALSLVHTSENTIISLSEIKIVSENISGRKWFPLEHSVHIGLSHSVSKTTQNW